MAELNEDQVFEMQETLRKRIRTWSRVMIGSAIAAVVSLLFGLGGTVSGMLKTFTRLAEDKSGDAKQLANGISESMHSSMTGSIVGSAFLVLFVVALCCYLSLRKKLTN